MSRGWLSSFDKMAAEAEPILSKYRAIILRNDRPQSEIYIDMKDEVTAAGLEMPGFRSFNRWVHRIYKPSKREILTTKAKAESSGLLVSARVSKEIHFTLHELAKAEGCTVSALLNDWIRQRLVMDGLLGNSDAA